MEPEDWAKKLIKGKNPEEYDGFNRSDPNSSQKAQEFRTEVAEIFSQMPPQIPQQVEYELYNIASTPSEITKAQIKNRYYGWYFRRKARREYNERRMAVRVLAISNNHYSQDALFRLARTEIGGEDLLGAYEIGLPPIYSPSGYETIGLAEESIRQEAVRALVHNPRRDEVVQRLLKVIEERSQGLATAIDILYKMFAISVLHEKRRELGKEARTHDEMDAILAEMKPALAEDFFGEETAMRIERGVGAVLADSQAQPNTRLYALWFLYDLRGKYSAGHLMRGARSGIIDIIHYALSDLMFLNDPHGLKAVNEATSILVGLRERVQGDEFTRIRKAKGQTDAEIEENRELFINGIDRCINQAGDKARAIIASICSKLDPENAASYSRDGNITLRQSEEFSTTLRRALSSVSALALLGGEYNASDMKTVVRALKQKQSASPKAQPIAAK